MLYQVQDPLQAGRDLPTSLGMSVKDILIHPDPRLKKVASPVDGVTPELRKLADDMLETMYDAPGIGLAAPQIGVLQRLIVLDCVKEEGATPEPTVMFNPKITWVSDETNVYDEGCLSIPEQYAEVTRPAEVRVSWLDVDGAPQEQQFEALWATCVQHEIDHLNGTLFIDHIGRMKREMITRKMVKLKRELART